MFGSLIFIWKNIEFRRQLLAVGIVQDTKESPCESLNRKMRFHPRLLCPILWPKRLWHFKGDSFAKCNCAFLLETNSFTIKCSANTDTHSAPSQTIVVVYELPSDHHLRLRMRTSSSMHLLIPWGSVFLDASHLPEVLRDGKDWNQTILPDAPKSKDRCHGTSSI